MSKEEPKNRVDEEDEEEELDEWDQRIFSTGCARKDLPWKMQKSKKSRVGSRSAEEQLKMNDCHFEKKDWRACQKESAQSAQSALGERPTSDALPAEVQPHDEDPNRIDWSKSFHGLSAQPFSKEIADILLAPVDPEDVEIKPDGIIFLPEIKYRRILNRAFGPGGWGLAPRSETVVTDKSVTREYALLAHGRLVSIARGEQDYFSKDGIPTASEGCKSNAMMRCCKDLGIASELWDPRFIRKFRASHTREVFVEHQVNKKKTKIWLRKGDPVSYPWRETKFGA
ncbi:hypothetical protein DV738_g2247, partial [Chaetothyriales sp. CBS 135597]